MKTVFVRAFLEVNLGDDLFLEAISRRYPEVRFVTLGPPKGCVAFAGLANVRYLKMSFILKAANSLAMTAASFPIVPWWLMRSADLYLRLGGSLFMQTENWRRKARLETFLASRAKRAMVLGSNFGPWRTEEFRKTYADLFGVFSAISFRDNASARQFGDIGNISVFPDLIFAYPNSERREPGHGLVVVPIEIAWREGLRSHREEYLGALARVVRQAVERGMPVRLMSFCRAQGDLSAVKGVLALLDEGIRSKVLVHSYEGDIGAALDFFARAEYVVASRFHAMILGWSRGMKVFSIVYSDKSVEVARDLGVENGWARMADCGGLDLPGILERAVELPRREDVAKAAEGHFRLFESVLFS